MPLNLYRISQKVNDDYDTYDSCVVAAESAEEARVMFPPDDNRPTTDEGWEYGEWARPEHVTVEPIGVACEGVPHGFVLCSFNAG